MKIKEYDYSKQAKYYDVLEKTLNEEKVIKFLNKIFKKHKVKTVLDMTCGTGAQTIPLKKLGYKVTGSDFSKEMLSFAKKKSKGLNIRYHHGDIRKSKFGKFDAVIALFNAIAHLSKRDFEKSIRNVGKNLNDKGLFIFDIFNLDFMKSGGFIKYLFIDKVAEINNLKFVRFSNNKLNSKNGVMKINQTTYIQKNIQKPEICKENWDMKIYTADQLRKLLEKNGFKVLKFFGGPGNKLIKKKSLSIYIVAQKK